MWRETCRFYDRRQIFGYISIHSLRVEGDIGKQSDGRHWRHFNPLPPCGGRQWTAPAFINASDFNPLPPCGGRPAGSPQPRHTLYFNPLPPCGGRLDRLRLARPERAQFQSTPSVWRETLPAAAKCIRLQISIHSLRVEGDCARTPHGCGTRFQSTPSVWRKTLKLLFEGVPYLISIHSLRVEGDFANMTHHRFSLISIHSLRVEGDRHDLHVPVCGANFNPLPPCGGRPHLFAHDVDPFVFQSTPSVWRETVCRPWVFPIFRFQSTPSVWRETAVPKNQKRDARISIHSLRVEGDAPNKMPAVRYAISIHSLRVEGDSTLHKYARGKVEISIHSLRVEGDLISSSRLSSATLFQSTPSVWRETLTAPPVLRRGCYFNPLPPCGGRPSPTTSPTTSQKFQSTPSVWRETNQSESTAHSWSISIHSLRVEGDAIIDRETFDAAQFQSTPSVWRETSMFPTV